MVQLNSATVRSSGHGSEGDRAINPLVRGVKSVFSGLLVTKSFIWMVFGDNSLGNVGDLADGLLGMSGYDLMARQLRQDPACAALMDERYIPPAHDLDALLTLPSDSLGHIYAKELKRSGFDPNLHADMEAISDAHYVEIRLSQTHDLWHVITGFDTSEIGEIGLQAFHLPQFPYPLATMLIASSLVSSTLMEPASLPKLLEAIACGFQMGKRAKSLFAQKWEEGWDKPLSQWQSELNIQLILANMNWQNP